MGKEQNIVFKELPVINNWEQAYARIDTLPDDNYRIPRIWAPNLNHTEPRFGPTILIISGMHLEETAGPRFCFNPNFFTVMRARGYNFLIYPIVNHRSQFVPHWGQANELRWNEQDINYNDGWGIVRKAKEVFLIERDIVSLFPILHIAFAATLHEDSVSPEHGYLWLNGPQDSLQKKLKKTMETTFYKNGKWMMMNIPDYGASENWIADTYHIQTFTIEAPFGAPMENRFAFYYKALTTAVNVFENRNSHSKIVFNNKS